MSEPRTEAGRALFYIHGSLAMRDAIRAIEDEAARKERERYQPIVEIVTRHTHQRLYAMTRFAGPDPEHDCHLCRALVAAGVLTLDQIGAGTRAAITDTGEETP